MIKALREAAAKVPVPKKDKMASPSRGTPLAAPAGGAAQRERGQLFHNTRLLLSEYNNALTGYKQADAAALPFFLSAVGKKLATTSDLIRQRTDAS